MIPLEAFLHGLERYIRREELEVRYDEVRIAGALRLAAELALGRAEDYPAALLFALSRDGRALGELWEVYPLLCARILARRLLNADLDVWPGNVELSNLRLRIAWKLADYEELRAFVAARMRPLG